MSIESQIQIGKIFQADITAEIMGFNPAILQEDITAQVLTSGTWALTDRILNSRSPYKHIIKNHVEQWNMASDTQTATGLQTATQIHLCARRLRAHETKTNNPLLQAFSVFHTLIPTLDPQRNPIEIIPDLLRYLNLDPLETMVLEKTLQLSFQRNERTITEADTQELPAESEAFLDALTLVSEKATIKDPLITAKNIVGIFIVKQWYQHIGKDSGKNAARAFEDVFISEDAFLTPAAKKEQTMRKMQHAREVRKYLGVLSRHTSQTLNYWKQTIGTHPLTNVMLLDAQRNIHEIQTEDFDIGRVIAFAAQKEQHALRHYKPFLPITIHHHLPIKEADETYPTKPEEIPEESRPLVAFSQTKMTMSNTHRDRQIGVTLIPEFAAGILSGEFEIFASEALRSISQSRTSAHQ